MNMNVTVRGSRTRRSLSVMGCVLSVSGLLAVPVKAVPGVAAGVGFGVGVASGPEKPEIERRVVVISPGQGLGRGMTGGAEDRSERSAEYRFVTEGKTFEVAVRNGKVESAKVDGGAIPIERVKLDDGSMTISDEAGKTLFKHEFEAEELGPMTGLGIGARGGARAFVIEGEGSPRMRWLTNVDRDAARAQADVEVVEPPAVMIGVQMGRVPDALSGHLGVDADRSVYVSGVYEGLPAHAAGLRPYGVIVGLNGSDGVSDQEIRAKLRELKVGDGLELSVIEGGVRKTVMVSAVAYDAEAFSKAKMEGVASGGATSELSSIWMGREGDTMGRLSRIGGPQGLGGPDADQDRRLIFELDAQGTDRGELREQMAELLGEAMKDGGWRRSLDSQAGEMDSIRRHMERLEKMVQELVEQQQRIVPKAPADGEKPKTGTVPERES